MVLAVAALIVFAILAPASPARAVPDTTCRVGEDIPLDRRSLPRTAAALKAGRPLTIVAIGSSSTQGYGASDPTRSYPAQLAARLKLRFPHSSIHVHNRGVGGDDINTMLARFPRDVAAAKPDLVIWQTGTNDAINHVPVDRFETLLGQGIRDLRHRGIDVLLMTPQYAPQFTGASGSLLYVEAMRRTGQQLGVPVFDRYDLSRAWSGDRRFADSPPLTADGLHQADSGYHCVAVILADRLAALVESDKAR